jgi:hypothetical protein
LQSKQRE